MDPIYLDHNATTPILPEVLGAMLPYLEAEFGNPSSGHVYGGRAREAIAIAREEVAEAIGASPEEIFFTSGGTEANNLAIRGTLAARIERRPGPAHVVTSVVEHPATTMPCAFLEQHGHRVERIGVGPDGRVSAAQIAGAITPDTALVTVMHSNNETGALQPIAEIAAAAHARGVLVHTDAAQSLGKVAVDVDRLGVDLMSIAGHKLYAPKGVGALYVRRGTPIVPLLLGAGHERGLRPGTENVASIVGLGRACALVTRDLATASERVRELRDRLHSRLALAIDGLNGPGSDRLPNTLNVRFRGVAGRTLLAETPSVAASTGSACHADTGEETASSVILAMGVAKAAALGSVRLSLGRSTTVEQVDRAAEALLTSWKKLTTGLA